MSAADALEVLPRLVDAYDEPFGNNSAIATYFCAQLASETGVRTLLAGDGGDEIFGGNERYTTDWIFNRYQLLPAWCAGPSWSRCCVTSRARRGRARPRAPLRPTRERSEPATVLPFGVLLRPGGRAGPQPRFPRRRRPGAPYAVLEEHYGRDASEELTASCTST